MLLGERPVRPCVERSAAEGNAPGGKAGEALCGAKRSGAKRSWGKGLTGFSGRALSLRVIFLAVALSGIAGVARADDAPPANPPDAAEKRIDVSVDADGPGATIERRANTVEGWQTTLGIPVYSATQQWEPSCVAPCRVKLDPNSTYRATGDGVAASSTFTLPSGKGAVSLHVHTRSAFLHDAGIGLTTFGAIFTVVGGVSSLYAKNITSTDAEATVRGFGLTILITGAVFLAVGLPLWLGGKSVVTAE